jgi:hypothetical protein
MNGFNATMHAQRAPNRNVFTRNPNVKLPDTVGLYKNKEKNLFDKFIFF